MDKSSTVPPNADAERIDAVIASARQALGARQAKDGHWVFELEADATIPAEYIFLNHYLDEINDDLEAKIAVYLRAIQGKHGGWPLFHDGDYDPSASVKAYYALKLVGDDMDAPHMKRAREAILAHGGAARVNVFSRFALALFGQLSWAAVPVMRVEILLAPRWFPFHINKVSYWSRTVMVPLLVLAALRPKARNPRNIGIPELFVDARERQNIPLSNPTGHWMGEIMLMADKLGRLAQPLLPKWLERKAIDRAMEFIKQRLNGEDGLGAIFPAMANSVMAMAALGYAPDHPDRATARKAIDLLIIEHEDRAYCQPCVSPVWDTGLALLALQEAGVGAADPTASRAADWLAQKQILDAPGDWCWNRDHVRPGGWAFQYGNDPYPDIDDTAVVAMALHRLDGEKYRENIDRAEEWVIGMQSKNGGWGAFDAENDYFVPKHIPFADHGAMLDPPTADVTARCVSMLAQLGAQRGDGDGASAMDRGLAYLRREQEQDGSWFGRWGTNYVYGTWSVLCALRAAGIAPSDPAVAKAVAFLKSRQRDDGGWGEDCATYWRARRGEVKESTPSQTAWAVLGLMSAGEENSTEVQHGIDYLAAAPRTGAKWDEAYYNAVGFPRIFFLRYHGYSAYFPLWALARHASLRGRNRVPESLGM